MKDQEIFNVLKRLAEENDFPTARLASAIVINSRIVSFGTNRMKSHPFQKKFGKNSSAIFWHSETLAISNSLRVIDIEALQKASIYTIRMKHPSSHDPSYVWAMAKPCDGCMNAIYKHRLKKVCYSIEENEYGTILL